MQHYSEIEIWSLIIIVGVVTFMFRFSFIGLMGQRKLPTVVMRMLRYTPVAVLPALVAPLVLWPESTGGAFDVPRMSAALVTCGVGLWTRHVLWSLIAGGSVFAALLYITG